MSLLLSLFDRNHERFATITPDQKIRIFDAATSRLCIECKEVNNLASRYTALAWGTLAVHESESQKKRKIDVSGTSQNGLVVGNARGELVIWDVETGEIAMRLGVSRAEDADVPGAKAGTSTVGHHASVTSVTWKDQRIASIDAEGTVLVWDAITGKCMMKFDCHHNGGSITSYKNYYVVGTNVIRLLSANNLTQSHKFKGHNTTIKLMTMAEGTSYLLTATADDRFILLWDCSAGSMSVVAKETFVADDNIVSLEAMSIQKNGKNVIRVISLTRHGEANIWDYTPTEEPKKRGKSVVHKPMQPSCRIRCKIGKSRRVVLNAVTLASTTIALAFINGVVPRFEPVNYVDESTHELKPSVVLELSEKDVTNAQASQEKEVKQDFKIVDSFAERAIEMKEDIPTQESFISDTSVTTRYPTNSLANALEQILTTRDTKRENEVLTTTDATIVENTIQRLAPAKAEQLLSVLVERIKSSPNSLSATCIWLKTLLSYHLSHFLHNSNDVHQQLIVAKAAIETRLRSQKKLESIAGRLALLMTQLSKSSNVSISKDFNDVVEGEDEQSSEDEDEDEEIEDVQESIEEEEGENNEEQEDDDDDDIADLMDA